MIGMHVLEICCVTAALLVVSNVWFLLRVLRPIRQLSAQAKHLSEGDLQAFEQTCGGIAEIHQLQGAMLGMVGHVRRAQEQKRAYTDRLAEGQEQERKRIARELHDDTIQSLLVVTQSLDMAKGWIKTDFERGLAMISTAREQTLTAIIHLRTLIGGLRPPALEELGLITALQIQIESIDQAAVRLQVSGEQRRLNETHELALFRAAQEALNNALRHSQASQIELDLDYQVDGVLLKVVDNGSGFEVPADLGELTLNNHYGLLGIEERIHYLGGWLKIMSAPGQGSTLQVYIPTQIQLADHLVKDPVCNALIETRKAYGSVRYEGVLYYFCCPVCQGAFQKDPLIYLK
ncbi:hypothetical protein MASR2M15_23500 [Anaerolineales bacterium]